MLRNDNLLRLCGFAAMAGVTAVPPSWVFSRIQPFSGQAETGAGGD